MEKEVEIENNQRLLDTNDVRMNVKEDSNSDILRLKVVDTCGFAMITLVFGVILGAKLAVFSRPSEPPKFELFDSFCDDQIDKFEESFCYAHDFTSRRSQMEYVDNNITNFIVLGDWGRNGHCCQHDVALEMSRIKNIHFVVNTGDNFYEDGLSSVDDVRISNSWLKVYNKNSLLSIPWYSVLGNHDYQSNTEPEIEMTEKFESWILPQRNYYKVINDFLLLVFIDTTPIVSFYRNEPDDGVLPFLPKHNIDEERVELLSFLNATFRSYEDNDAIRWRIVVGHHPIFTVGEHYGQDDDTGFLEGTLVKSFIQNKVDVYFSGHDHNLQHLQYQSLNLFISGAGSKIRSFPLNRHNFSTYDRGTDTAIPRFHVGQQGFIGVSSSTEELLVQFFNMRGSWMYSKILRK